MKEKPTPSTIAIFATSYQASQTRNNAPDLTPAQMESAAYILARMAEPAAKVKKGFYIHGADRATRTAFALAISAVCDTAALPNTFCEIRESKEAYNCLYTEFDPVAQADVLRERFRAKTKYGVLTFATSAVHPKEVFARLPQFYKDVIVVLFESISL